MTSELLSFFLGGIRPEQQNSWDCARRGGNRAGERALRVPARSLTSEKTPNPRLRCSLKVDGLARLASPDYAILVLKVAL